MRTQFLVIIQDLGGLMTQNPRNTQDPCRNQDSLWIWDFRGFKNLWRLRTQMAKAFQTSSDII